MALPTYCICESHKDGGWSRRQPGTNHSETSPGASGALVDGDREQRATQWHEEPEAMSPNRQIRPRVTNFMLRSASSFRTSLGKFLLQTSQGIHGSKDVFPRDH